MTQALDYGFEGDRAYGNYYRHSGKVTPLGIVAGIVVGLVAALALAWAYAYADSYVPIVYLNAAIAAAFGAAIGYATAAPMKWGNVRNGPLTLTLTAIVTLIAYWLSWAAWACVIFDRYAKNGRPFGFVELLVHPAALLDVVRILNESGTFSIGHSYSSSTSGGNGNVSGLMLDVIWLGEAIVVFGCALLVAKAIGVARPFCERCLAWSEPAKPIARLTAGDAPAARLAMENHDWPKLAEITSGPLDESNVWTLSHGRCATCDDLHLLSLDGVKTTVDRKGKTQTATSSIVSRLRVGPDDVTAARAAVEPTWERPPVDAVSVASPSNAPAANDAPPA